MEQFYRQAEKFIRSIKDIVPDHSLMHGHIGLCLLYYHLSRRTDNAEYEQMADELLDKVFSSLSIGTSTEFERGLCGIGWGIAYLVHNGYTEGDTDEILEEVDNKVFRALNENSQPSFELTNGLTGYLFYLVSRLESSPNPDSVDQQIVRELLILVINKLDEVVPKQFFLITKDMHFDWLWRFPIMLYGLVKTFELNIYKEKIRCLVKQWTVSLETLLPSMQINRLYLAAILTEINRCMPDKRIEKQIKILLYATDFEELKKEVFPNEHNLRYGWYGFDLPF